SWRERNHGSIACRRYKERAWNHLPRSCRSSPGRYEPLDVDLRRSDLGFFPGTVEDTGRRYRHGRWSQFLFGEHAKLVRNGTENSQGDRPVCDRSPSEAIADLVDGAISRPTRHPSFAAGAAPLVFKPKGEFQLHFRVLLEMRHGDRQERDALLVR